MATNIPRWTPSPKRQEEKQPSKDNLSQGDLAVADSDDEIISRSAEFFSNRKLDSLGHAEFIPRPRPHANILINDRQVYDDSGVCLTWRDICVTVVNPKGGSKTLLQGLTGYAYPGQMVAIMGPSGSGKSTLLDTLAGRLGAATRQSGDLLINGRTQTLSYGSSAYVTQDDTLMATLTVGEAVLYSAQVQLPSSMSSAEKRERAEMTIREMGLQDSVNTRIGGWRKKGISGGEKRRVSISIEILTRPELLFLDEPTSGLDSAAAYHVMKRIARLAREDGRTVIASMHQPSTEVFELFHNLYLLAGGRTVYFGEVSQASEFFAISGFPCPSLRNPSDHYLYTINKDFERDEDAEGNMNTSEVIDILVRSYPLSDIGKAVLNRVNDISNREGAPLKMKGSQANFLMQSYVLTKRSFVNMYRDLGYYWLRLAIYVALCVCVGTIFYDVGQDFGAIQARGAMLMFVAAFLTFMAIGGFPSFVEDMKVFQRERLNGHYGVGAFVIANTLSSLPYLMLISVVPGAIAYFLVNLHSGLEHFIFFVLVLFACMMLVESLMMMVASIVPDFLMGIITGAGIQGVMMLNGGFFRLPNDLPKPFWRYPMYYIAFHKYANQAFYKNDFSGLKFTSEHAGSPPVTGDEILRNTWQVEMGYSKWVDLLILVGMVAAYRIFFFSIIKMKEKAKPFIRAKLSKTMYGREVMPTIAMESV